MTQQPMGLAPAPEARLKFGPGLTQELPADLAQAVLCELWAASPDRFGNLVKKAMIRLWGGSAKPSPNGRHGG
jgi:hypothetical protein